MTAADIILPIAVEGVFTYLLPETSAFLGNAVDCRKPDDPYEIASCIMQADSQEPLPEYLIDAIIELLEDAASEGNAEAMNDLGSHYYVGRRGFPQDFTQAMRLYEQAAENGSRQAQENLGYCYYYGRNGEKDYEKAFHYFALGAFDGHIISLYKIGDMYRNGYYVEKNEREAFLIYERCLETMTDEAAGETAGPVYLRYGDMKLEGRGTEQDAEAAQWAYQNAERYLGRMVRTGDAMYEKSLRQAIEGQEKARALLEKQKPEGTWPFD